MCNAIAEYALLGRFRLCNKDPFRGFDDEPTPLLALHAEFFNFDALIPKIAE